jgi:ATP-dependent RNA helicase DHX57
MMISVKDYYAALEAFKKASPVSKTYLWSLTPFETAASAPIHSSAPGVSSSSSSMPPSIASSPFSSTDNTPSTSRSATPTSRTDAVTLSKWWKEAPEVKMPQTLRDLVEETVREMMTEFPSGNLHEQEKDEADIEEPSEEESHAKKILLQMSWVSEAFQRLTGSRLDIVICYRG